MSLSSSLLLAVALAALLGVWCAAPCLGQGLPGVALVEPSSLVWGYAPYQFGAAEQGTGIAFLALNDNAWGQDSSGRVVAQTNASFATPGHPSSFESRPHSGVIWMVMAPQGEVLGDAGLALLNASTLQVMRLLAFNTSAFSPPASDLHTYISSLSDLSGRLYLIIASDIYVLDPLTGAQTGHFSVPNYDDPALGTAGGALQNQGYFIAQHPDGSLYMLDSNFFPNGTWPAFHTSLDGTLLDQGWIDVGPSDGIQSFVIDSAGFMLISVYTPDPEAAVAFKVDTSYRTVGNVSFGITASTPLNVDGVGDYYDLEISVSWGATPEQDVLYGYVWPYQPVYACQLSTPVACQSLYSTPYALLDNGVIQYDAHLDSFIVSQGMGPYSAVRVDSKASALLGTYVLPVNSLGVPEAVSIAVDGAGGVVFGHVTTAPYEADDWAQLSFFQGSQLVFTINASEPEPPVAIDPVKKLIYSLTDNNPPTLQVLDYTGSTVGTVTGNGGGFLLSMQYHLSASGASTVVFVSNGVGLLLQMDLQSGAVSTLLSLGNSLDLTQFALSPDSSVAYVVGQEDYDDGPTGIFHTLAVQLSSGAVIAELDLLHSPPYLRDGTPAGGDGSLTVDGSGNVWVVQAQLQFSSTTGLLVFAPQTAPSTSVLGDPQFIGLRGQSYQVHGIDGGVYALVSSESTQVNARFVFLSSGQCPPIPTQCWSHPGSYLQAIGVQQFVPASGTLHRLSITAGAAASGFGNVTHNGRLVGIGESFSEGVFSFSLQSAYELEVRTEQLAFVFSNSDQFINQAVQPLLSLSRLSGHGLLGQTHSTKLHRSTLRHIEGEVDDYLVSGDSLFHTDFLYNQFQHSEAK